VIFADLIAKDIRLVILRALAEDGYSLNESTLQSVLVQFGHNVSRDRVRTEIGWLAEQGLVTCDDVSGLFVARLTVRGQDVAAGRARIDGVKPPRPGE
jgi:DNA-binding GntR family transcriptional regulator